MNELKASQRKLKQMMLLNPNVATGNSLKVNSKQTTNKKESNFFQKFSSSSLHNNELENQEFENEDDEDEEEEDDEDDEEDDALYGNESQGGGLSFDSGEIDDENKFQLAGLFASNEDDEEEDDEEEDEDDDDESNEYDEHNEGDSIEDEHGVEQQHHSASNIFQGSDTVQVTCGTGTVGTMHLKKFGSGKKGKCIQVLIEKTNASGEIEKEEKWLTPIEFESFSGKANCRDWKRTIKVGGQQLYSLFETKVLLCHAVSCSCGICTNNSEISGPIRPFVKYRRRKKDEIQAQNAYKKFLRLKPPTLPASLLQIKGMSQINGNAYGATSNNNSLEMKNETDFNLSNNIGSFSQGKRQKETNNLRQETNFKQFSNSFKLPKVSKLISEVAQEMASVEENTWEPLEQMATQLMNQVQALRKMIDKAKTQDKLSRHNLMNQLIILNSQTKSNLSRKKFSNQLISKKRKFNHDFAMNNNNLNNSEIDNSKNYNQNILNNNNEKS